MGNRRTSGTHPRKRAPRFRFTGELYTTVSFGPMAFVSLPEAVADSIEALPPLPRRGFGSLRVEVTAEASSGEVTWRTSLFPGTDTYVLPIKRPIRTACAVDIGDALAVEILLLDWA